MRQKQGRDGHPESKGVGIPRVRRNAVKRCLSHLYSSILQGFVFLQASYLDSSATPDLPYVDVQAPFSQDGSPSEGFWEEKDSLWPGISLDFDPQEAFLCIHSVSLVRKRGGEEKQRPLNPLLKEGFALYPCHDYCLESIYWPFTVPIVTSISQGKQELIVNALTGAHLSIVSRNADSFKYSAWSPRLHTSWNANRRPVIDV